MPKFMILNTHAVALRGINKFAYEILWHGWLMLVRPATATCLNTTPTPKLVVTPIREIREMPNEPKTTENLKIKARNCKLEIEAQCKRGRRGGEGKKKGRSEREAKNNAIHNSDVETS